MSTVRKYAEEALVAVAAAMGDPDTKTLIEESVHAILYGVILKRAVRRGGDIIAKLRTGESLTRKDAAAIVAIVQYVPLFVASGRTIGQTRVVRALGAAERMAAKRSGGSKLSPEAVKLAEVFRRAAADPAGGASSPVEGLFNDLFTPKTAAQGGAKS